MCKDSSLQKFTGELKIRALLTGHCCEGSFMKFEFRIADLLMKLSFGFSVLTSPYSLYADWDPEDCLFDLEPSAFEVLNDSGFQELKGRVVEALKGSWCSEEKINLLMDLVCITQPDVCVEIGAFSGSSVLPVAATLKQLNRGKIYAIDAWSNRVTVKNLAEDDPNKLWWSKINMRSVRNIFNQMIETWGLSNVCTPIRKPSEKAIHQLSAIDFLHLDGDYSAIGSMQDVELYLPKVKSGGYILLSNLFIMVNNEQPKLNAFNALFECCEIVCEIENENAILFQKN